MIKRVVQAIGIVLLAMVGVQVFNTISSSPEANTVERVELPSVDQSIVAAHLGEAIRIRTISTSSDMTERGPAFTEFTDWLVTTYPAANKAMKRTMIAGLTPLYRWQGSNETLKPILLTAHYDVVPVAQTGLDDWEQPPFSGVQSDGFIWGRGALDDKSAVVAIMEAVEALVEGGYTPERTIYLSFGHDEEIGGADGAGGVVSYLKEQGIQMAWSLDEGSMILKDVVPGIDDPVASINVAEKGYVSLDITAYAEGGHSSLPPRETAVSILAQGLTNLQSAPVPGGLTGVSQEFFEALGPHFSLEKRVMFANLWLYRPILNMVLSGSAATDAMLRSSKAPTMLSGSAKDNVLPQEAVATVNYRIHPRDSIETIVAHTIEMIDNPDISVAILGGEGREPSEVSSSVSAGFATLDRTFRQVFGNVIVVSGLTVAGTDSRHYAQVSDDSYRINPFVFSGEDIKRLHGRNERISIKGMEQAVQFYTVLIRNAAQ